MIILNLCMLEVEEENHVETKEEAVKRVAEPLSVNIEKKQKKISIQRSLWRKEITAYIQVLRYWFLKVS